MFQRCVETTLDSGYFTQNSQLVTSLEAELVGLQHVLQTPPPRVSCRVRMRVQSAVVSKMCQLVVSTGRKNKRVDIGT